MSQVPTHNLSVVAEGLSRLTSCYQKLPKVTGLASAILASVQELEDVAWTILNGVNLDPATPPTGQLLDNIAALVNLTRQGLNDEQLWLKFKLELLVLRSRGRSEDVLKVANAVAPSQVIEGLGTAIFLLSSWNIPLAGFTQFVQAIARAKPGGVRCVFNYSTFPTTQSLVFGSRYGGNPGQNTLASRYGAVANAGLLVASTTIEGV